MTTSQTYFKTLINSVIPFKNSELKRLFSIFEDRIYPKGYLMIETGQVSQEVIFIANGIVREFAFINNEDHTYWISGNGELVAAPGDFVSDQPSIISAETLIETHTLVANKADFVSLMIEMPKMSLLMNYMYQLAFSNNIQHMLLLKVIPTQKREEMLFQQKPFLFRKEVKIRHLASLLNVHPNSLSRIHNQKNENKKN